MTTRSSGQTSTLGSHASDSRTIALRHPVLVGVDGSPASVSAATWAAAEAQALDVPLQVISTYLHGLLDPWSSGPDPLVTAQLRHEALHTVRTAIASIRDDFPALIVSGEAVEGDPRDVLARRGMDASMVVVGTRHMHALGRTVLGSVSARLTASASCPVVVLCAPPGLAGERPSVVVGVTGEPGTDNVLAFAFRQAQVHRLPLHALMFWRPDQSAERHSLAEPPAPQRAERWLAEALAGWRDQYPDVDVHAAVVRDHAVSGLVSAAASQHLLVVGRRGRRARLGSLLGSVGQGVLHHATCPVAVVPVPDAS